MALTAYIVSTAQSIGVANTFASKLDLNNGGCRRIHPEECPRVRATDDQVFLLGSATMPLALALAGTCRTKRNPFKSN